MYLLMYMNLSICPESDSPAIAASSISRTSASITHALHSTFITRHYILCGEKNVHTSLMGHTANFLTAHVRVL